MKFEALLNTVRRHLWWIAPVVVLIINGVILSSYQSLYAGRARALSEAIVKERDQLARLSTQHQEIAALVSRSKAAADGINTLYGQRFATESERLTGVIREVRELAARAGVIPDRVAYPEELFEDYGLIKRSMNFAVEGTYRELRLFVNYLELSDSFLVLESLGLQDSDQGLRIRVTLSTFFSGRDAPFTVTLAESETEG